MTVHTPRVPSPSKSAPSPSTVSSTPPPLTALALKADKSAGARVKSAGAAHRAVSAARSGRLQGRPHSTEPATGGQNAGDNSPSRISSQQRKSVQIVRGSVVTHAPSTANVGATKTLASGKEDVGAANSVHDSHHSSQRKSLGPGARPRRARIEGAASRAALACTTAGSPLLPKPGSISSPARIAFVERCSRCVRESVWAACDVFWTFDVKRSGEITRAMYSASLADAPTVERLRFLRRSRLEARFRRSREAVKLNEFLRMIWPAATPEDLKLMDRWSQLREAWAVLMDKGFCGAENQTRRVFELLDEGDGEFRASELTRAQILTPHDAYRLLKTTTLKKRIAFEEFRNVISPHLKSTYILAETVKRMQAEENALGCGLDMLSKSPK